MHRRLRGRVETRLARELGALVGDPLRRLLGRVIDRLRLLDLADVAETGGGAGHHVDERPPHREHGAARAGHQPPAHGDGGARVVGAVKGDQQGGGGAVSG